MRGPEELFELRQILLGEVREDAAAVVVDDHQRRCRLRAEPEQPVDVVQEAQVAAQADDRRGRRRDSRHGRHEAVDAVGAAVRQHAQIVARRHAPLERAHGQARCHDQRGAGWKGGREVARHHTLEGRVRVVEDAVDRGAARALGCEPAVEPPVGRWCGSEVLERPRGRVEQRFGRFGDALTCVVGGVEPRPVRIDDDLGDVSVEPRVRDLARERGTDPQHEVGLVRRRERGHAQQRLVGRDRVRSRRGVARWDRRGSASPPRPRSGSRSRARPRRPIPRPADLSDGRARSARVARRSRPRHHDSRAASVSTVRRQDDRVRRTAARRSARVARGTEG